MTPIRTYTTVVHGQVVPVKVYEAQKHEGGCTVKFTCGFRYSVDVGATDQPREGAIKPLGAKSARTLTAIDDRIKW